MCWLNNRKPEQWKRNRDMLQTKDEDSKITVNIIRHGKEDKDEDWNVSATKKTEKASVKKAATPSDDLDYWPDDWDEE